MNTITNDLLVDRVRRDRWGRYLVVPPNGTKPVGYTRATTVAKALDDQGGLMNWRSRMVLLGVTQRADLLALAATADPTDKRTLDDICERAAEAGGATVRRDLGTALHSMLERRWTDPNFVAPAPYDADVDAVISALNDAKLTVAEGLHERIVVNDRYQIAGTFDLIVEDHVGGRYIADIKTGSSIELGSLAFAIQLSIYANADALYTQGIAKDGSDDVREPMPELSTDTGIIIHVEPGSATCNIHTLDLTVGANALDLAVQVREMRKTKPVTKWVPPLTPVSTEVAVEMVKQHFPGAELVDETTETVDDDWRDWARVCIKQIIDAGHKTQMRQMWPDNVPTLASGEPITIEQGERLAEAIQELGQTFQLEFFPPQPGAKTFNDEPKQRGTVKSKFDDDETVTGNDLNNLAKQVAQLDVQEKRFLDRWSSQCSQRGVSIAINGLKGIPSVRRVTICRTLTALAPHRDDSVLTAVIHTVTGDTKRSLVMQLGSLTKQQAEHALKIANGINNGSVVLTWDENDTCVLTGEIPAAPAA
jgi:hypothetical protein